MFGRSWKIATIGGIAIRVDRSWTFIAVFITYSFWYRFDVEAPYRHLGRGAMLGLAVFAAALFFGSVLAHELAHAGTARARGIPVSGITLWLFGGATSARIEDKGPKDEFLVTAAGPATSLALGALFWGLSKTGSVISPSVAGALGDLGWINFILGAFNLVPGFPLDGGRLLRSIVWRITGDLDRATGVAGWTGSVVAAGLIVAGLVEATQRDFGGGLWLAFIGWFLLQAAQGSLRQRRLRRLLAAGTAAEAMSPPPRAIPAGMTLSEALFTYLAGHEEQVFPVVEDGRVIGMLSFASARRIGRRDPMRPVRDAVIPLKDANAVTETERLDRVAELVGGGESAIVLRDGQLVGSITPNDLSRWMRVAIPPNGIEPGERSGRWSRRLFGGGG
ncbi:MAG: site-2 protease family protein [Actinomycetota bacterium]|nr:site-2 protease family protein [Actinomycetota bacterium]